MVGAVIGEMHEKGYEARIIPAEILKNARTEMEGLYNEGRFDKDFYEVLKGCHDYSFAGISFQVRSVILVASPSPGVKVYFNCNGKRVPLIIPPTYLDYPSDPVRILGALGEILDKYGFHAERVYSLPEKLLAARSGLGVYGRNNLCYVKGMGSFALLSAYCSDMPYGEDNWNEITLMESCRNCSTCINNCPTGALSDESFLVKAERCVTYYNEFTEAAEFPQWMDPSAHNCIVGCLRCQACCPENRSRLKDIAESVEFSECETELLLEGCAREELPGILAEKIDRLGLKGYYNHLARNLKALLDGQK